MVNFSCDNSALVGEAIEKRQPEQVILRREVGSRAPAPRNATKQRSRPSRP
jgi:hypothetical protein